MEFYTQNAPLKIMAILVFCNNVFGSDQTVPLKVHKMRALLIHSLAAFIKEFKLHRIEAFMGVVFHGRIAIAITETN